MRKVKFNRYVPERFTHSQGIHRVEGTGDYEVDYPNEGMFLGFGTSSSAHNDILVEVYSVALIELRDGTIEEVFPERIKFVNPSFIDRTKMSPDEFKKQYEQNSGQPIIDIANRIITDLGYSSALARCDKDIAESEYEEEIHYIGRVRDAIVLHRPVNLWKLKDDTKEGEE